MPQGHSFLSSFVVEMEVAVGAVVAVVVVEGIVAQRVEVAAGLRAEAMTQEEAARVVRAGIVELAVDARFGVQHPQAKGKQDDRYQLPPQRNC